jgi:hypothetical protein
MTERAAGLARFGHEVFGHSKRGFRASRNAKTSRVVCGRVIRCRTIRRIPMVDAGFGRLPLLTQAAYARLLDLLLSDEGGPVVGTTLVSKLIRGRRY